MKSLDNPQPEPAAAPTSFGWCSWHDGHSDGVRLVRVVEQGSGPGGSLFACSSCRKAHGLIPLADQP